MENDKIESGKKHVKRNVLKIALLVVCGLLILGMFLMPAILKSVLLHSFRTMGFDNPRLTIRHVGSRQIDIQQLTLGDTQKPDLIIPSLAIDFSLLELLHGRVEKIEIAGMTLNVTADQRGVTIKGLEALFAGKKGGKLTLPVRQVHIASSLARVDWNGRRIVVPFELQAATDSKGEAMVLAAALYPYGETVAMNGKLNIASGDGTLSVAAEQSDLGKYLADLNAPLFQWLRSRARWNAEINLKAWEVSADRLSLSAPAFSAGFPGATLSAALQLDCRLNREWKPEDIQLKLHVASAEQSDLQIEIPFALDIAGSRLGDLKFMLGDVQMKSPPGIVLKNLHGTASLQGDQWRLEGSYGAAADAAFFKWLFPAMSMKGNLAVSGDFQAATGGGRSTWKLKGTGRGGVSLPLPHFQAKAAGLAFAITSVSTGENVKNDLDVELKGVAGGSRYWLFSASQLRCLGTMEKAGAGKWFTAGKLSIASAALKQEGGLAAEGLFIDMPWRFPPPATSGGKDEMTVASAPGSWRIASVQVEELNLGRLTGKVGQKGQGLEFSGTAQTPLEKVKAELAGSCLWQDDGIAVALAIEIPETQLAKNSRLQGLHPALAGYRCAGRVSASGKIAYAAGALRSQAWMKVAAWDMADDVGGLDFRGLNATVRFRDLLNIRSEFSQRLDFTQLAISGLQLQKGKLFFDIDGSESLYIEGGEFAFSGGRILLQPFRYNFQDKQLKVTLYSDRINFAEMLNTLLGEKTASGDAEVNGLLTVDVIDGLPVFRDGYLYSTPGVGGNIKFSRSETISGGVLIVEEAVKDFNYDWIKVKLDTAKENLNMIVFINGVPAQKLPLTYDTKKKDIIRDSSGQRNLELKGLLLELRFNDIDLKGLLKSGAKMNFQNKKVP